MDTGADAWPGGLSGFNNTMDIGQHGEDWEDWLRWDPAVEPTSPEDGTFNSGSSKNDSPIQDPALPVADGLFGKGGDTLAPPMIMGDEPLGFSAASVPDNEPFLFGASNDAAAGFQFDNDPAFQPLPPAVPKLDTTWPLMPEVPAQDINVSALAATQTRPPPPDLSPATATATTPSLQYSPDSFKNERKAKSSSGSPGAAPKKKGGRKRKIEVEEEPPVENGDSQDGDEPPSKKTTSHNVIEKRYRNNLNDKIVELRNSVPSLRAIGRANGGEDSEDLEGLTPAHKLNKATVMGKATEYIRHLEKRNKAMAEEMDQLKARLAAIEEAIGKNRDRQASTSSSPPNSRIRTRQPSSASQSGFLNVPQQPGMQPQYMQQQQQQPVYARPPNPPVDAQNQLHPVYGRGGGVMTKVMMGAMAGVMVMEGFSENQDNTQGLFAVPTALFKRGVADMPSSPATVARHAGMPLLKIFCIIGALLYLITPLLTFSPRRKDKARPVIRLPQAPSLASPVEVRRKAWLTAMQTVYVPKHFLLEVAAVTSKMFKLSLRKMVGDAIWNAVLGINEEDEAARIKAWDIAIDAQLAGGDAEISYKRLLLTLMASGTLPDSPTRLMQKAVHFRVFFWELSNAGYGSITGFKSFTEMVGQWYWNSAKRIQKELVAATSLGSKDGENELLPDHLASLLELDCDEVLSDEMIQRAWNLAWNKPSAYCTTPNAARDSVVEDHAIHSPLDAVAAWYANTVVDDALLDNLADHPSSMDTEYFLNLAISVSPPASATQARTLAARAVLSNTTREANILAALEALPTAAEASSNFVSHAPAAPDVHIALTMAKLLSLLSPCASAAAHGRAYETLATLHLPQSSFTLLTAIASYRILRVTSIIDRRHGLPSHSANGLMDLATELRAWVGTSVGRRAGLDSEDCGRLVDACLGVAKKLGGWDERDSGYGSVETSPVRANGEAVF
ncbi:hypothetical protein Tdes44962_MAKER09266 [Teratosphaeria destructans]|uniref:BHLH domain-containing protein n=1 Tax=Teratosphaeria destructans TaxID=418781 RepID=A0A9W7W397_9PEZI|nr:hypothetical protein Tdes44962_MAKER09266 [Teratosphaeria destructans]